MKRSKRLSPVIELAEKETKAALTKVGEVNTLWLQDKHQLDELHVYKGEYLAKFRQGDDLVMSAQKVLELRRFLAQLDQAIEAQKQQVNNRLHQLEQQREVWKQARTKEKVMQSLIDRYKDEESHKEARQEQLDNDERNTSQWLRRRN